MLDYALEMTFPASDPFTAYVAEREGSAENEALPRRRTRASAGSPASRTTIRLPRTAGAICSTRFAASAIPPLPKAPKTRN